MFCALFPLSFVKSSCKHHLRHRDACALSSGHVLCSLVAGKQLVGPLVAMAELAN